MADTLRAQLKDRVPPHNNEAEQATLGSVLLDGEALERVIPIIREKDFYRAAHRKVFESIIKLYDRGEAIDLITLTDELRASGNLHACGGPGYISQLTSAVPTSANVEYYARIVREASIRRRLLRIAAEITADAQDESQEVRVIVDEAEKRIFEIGEEHAEDAIKDIKKVVTQTVRAIERLHNSHDDYTGVPSGFAELDRMLSGFQDSDFVVVGARPGMGKTALALTMAANMSVHKQVPVGFFSLEMSDQAIMQRLLAMESRTPSQKIRTGNLRPADLASLMEAASQIYDAPLYISDTPSLKLLDLRAIARRMVSRSGVKIIFVDYITLVGAEDTSAPRHEQIAEISRSLKAMARELQIPIVALSQVSRDAEGKQPTLANIRESGSIEQDADVVLLLHRNRATGRREADASPQAETELIIAKQRNGPVGTITIAFIEEYTKFEALERGYD